MGYRSYVALAFKKDAVSKEVIDEAKKYWDESYWREREEDVILFYAEEVKWYDSYSDVQAIENIIQSMDEENYQFIRIGEEPGDIEERGSAYLSLYTSTTIIGVE